MENFSFLGSLLTKLRNVFLSYLLLPVENEEMTRIFNPLSKFIMFFRQSASKQVCVNMAYDMPNILLKTIKREKSICQQIKHEKVEFKGHNYLMIQVSVNFLSNLILQGD